MDESTLVRLLTVSFQFSMLVGDQHWHRLFLHFQTINNEFTYALTIIGADDT